MSNQEHSMASTTENQNSQSSNDTSEKGEMSPAVETTEDTSKLSKESSSEKKAVPFGVFYAALRRPKTQKDGLIALFFGENGEDADAMTPLHLSRYQEIFFLVKVWRIKDADGMSQRGIGLDGKPLENKKEFPLITQFVAKSKRPQPSAHGQTAQFFGKNGRHADSVTKLAQSAYQDNLVYVELYKHEDTDDFVEALDDRPFDVIEDTAGTKTKVEKEKAKIAGEKDRAFFEKMLNSGFLNQLSVIKHLGTPRGYKAWLSHQKCAYPYASESNEDKGAVSAFSIKDFIDVANVPADYLYLPICEKHHSELKDAFLQDNDEKHEHIRRYAIIESKRQLEMFTKIRLLEQLDIPANHIPRRDTIEAWAVEKDVLHLL